MTAPEKNQPAQDALVERFLRSIRHQFYRERDKQFFQERFMLLQSITYPASWLHQRGVGLPAERYKNLLTGIIRTINAHGNLAAIRTPGRYLLHAVQEHMRHHGEDYYEAGKRTRDALDDLLHGLQPRSKIVAADVKDANPVPALAEAHRLLLASKPAGGRKKKTPEKPVSTPLQPDLFNQKTQRRQ